MQNLVREILAKCCIKGEDSNNDVKNAIICCVTTKELNLDFRDEQEEGESSSSESQDEKRGEDDRKETTKSILQLWKRRCIAKQSEETSSTFKSSDSNIKPSERVSE